MPKSYSDDLRCKLLEAWEAGDGSLQGLAEQFHVSWGFTKKIRMQQLQTGQKERLPQSHHGPNSRVTESVRANLRDWLRQQPDLTQAELRDRLQEIGVRVCESRVGQVLREMGFRRKKNLSTPRNGTRKATNNGGPSSANSSARSRRNS